MFRTFDFAGPDTHSPQRPRTTVPQQALVLMNSPWMMQLVEGLIEPTKPGLSGASPAAVANLYRRIYARDPTVLETDLGIDYLQAAHGLPSASTTQLGPWQQYAHALLMANEFVFID
jgi:hypothetical protein